MRIKEIRIEGLFGLFDHTIPLNMEEGLTIVYGENGIGKTMIFRMLDWMLGGHKSKLEEIPFKKLILTLDNNDYIQLTKDNNLLSLIQNEDSLALLDWNLTELKSEIINFSYRKLGYNKIHNKDEFIRDDENRYSFIELVKKHLSDFPVDIKSNIHFEKPDICIHLIKTTRLFSDKKRIKRSVDLFNIGLSEKIEIKEKEYLQLSKQLESSLGKRIVEKQVKIDLSLSKLRKKTLLVNKKLEEFRRVGLLSFHKQEPFDIREDLDDTSKAIIDVNIQDFQIKLKVFDDLYEKLSLFLDIINNRRFSYKKMYITSEGFKFKNIKGDIIKPSQLSSGEQHELILIYRLLFEVPEGSLILIDEPEISLHIVWQKDFVEDMLEIIKLRNLDILVATHSPSIINGHWDLTVSLKGIEEEAYV